MFSERCELADWVRAFPIITLTSTLQLRHYNRFSRTGACWPFRAHKTNQLKSPESAFKTFQYIKKSPQYIRHTPIHLKVVSVIALRVESLPVRVEEPNEVNPS